MVCLLVDWAEPVSYTHLDVYKRQVYKYCTLPCLADIPITMAPSIVDVLNNYVLITSLLDVLVTSPKDIYRFHMAVRKTTPQYDDEFFIKYLKRKRKNSKQLDILYREFWFTYILDTTRLDVLVEFFPWHDESYYSACISDEVYLRLYKDYINFNWVNPEIILNDETLLDEIKDAVDWSHLSTCSNLQKTEDFFLKYVDYLDWENMSYNHVPPNLHHHRSLVKKINWRKYTKYMVLTAQTLLDFKEYLCWRSIDYNLILWSSTDLAMYRELKDFINWTLLSCATVPFDKSFLLEFQDHIKWDVIDYDYLPGSVFVDERFSTVLDPNRCCFTKPNIRRRRRWNKLKTLEEKAMSVTYNYRIKEENVFKEGLRDYVSIDWLLSQPNLTRDKGGLRS